MFVFLAAVLGICCVAVFLVGLFVLLRDPERSENRWFFALAVATVFWSGCNFIGSNVVSATTTEIFVKLDFSSALLLSWCMLQFVATIVGSSSRTNQSLPLKAVHLPGFNALSSAINSILILLIVFDVLLTVGIAGGSLEVTTSGLFYAYVLVILAYLGMALWALISGYVSSGREGRKRLNLLVLGFGIAIFTNVLTNLVFPELFTSRSVIQALNIFGYLGIFAFVLCVYLAIFRRKLFDIRLVLARSFAYFVVVGLITLGYSVLVTLTSFIFLNNQKFDPRTIAVGIVAILFVAATYEYLKRNIARATNKLFFRNSYEPQDVLDKLNSVTSNTIDLGSILTQSAELFKQTFKAEKCVFILFNKQGRLDRIVGAIDGEDYKTVAVLAKPLARTKDAYRTDDLENGELKTALVKSASEALVVLYANKDFIGFIILGEKQNGVSYLTQDMKLLSTGAASLSVAIQNALRFEEIESFNLTLQQKVDEATGKLRRSNDKLRKLDETKDDFISMASHQLRTPLTSVKGYVSMVLDGDAGKLNALQTKLLTQSFVSAQRMVYLISDLLNVSRLKTGKFIIEPTPTNIAKVIDQEIDQLVETAKGRKLELSYHKPEHFPTYMLDETKLRQVIMNFVDNAIYYTPSGGNITVNLEDKPKTIEMTVTDDGIGVPRHEQHHLFSKFFRAHNAQRARPDGTGLGLFMAKKVIIAQGGAIIFRSQEGKGSTFGFTFAKSRLQPVETKHIAKKD